MAKQYEQGKLVLKQEKEDKSGRTVTLGKVVENADVEELKQTRDILNKFYIDPFSSAKLHQTYDIA